jgi:hypothetical protein
VTAIVGGFRGQGLWSAIPYYELDLPEDCRWAYMQEAPLRNFETRLWDVRDGLVERIWRGVYSSRFMMTPAIAAATNYAARCQATIVSVRDNDSRPVDQFRHRSVDSKSPYEMFSAGRKFVHVRVRNDGEVPLYGYQTGMELGLARMTYKVIDEAGKVVFEGFPIHVSGIIGPGETGDALGSMEIPMIAGRYRIEGRIVANGIGYCGPPRDLGTMQVDGPPWLVSTTTGGTCRRK